MPANDAFPVPDQGLESSGVEWRWAQAEIRRLTDLNEAWLQAFSELGYGALITDGGRILYANEAFMQLSGYSLEELVALDSFYRLVPEDQQRELRPRMQNRLMGARVDDHYLTALFHRQGHRITVEALVKVAHLDGTPHVIAVVRDVART